jgi:DNA-binding NtrC family response regulator
MRAIAATIAQVASFQCSVLIAGETGSGKEVVARRIHANGPRADGAFVAVNCGALVTSLAESQLFGHERGAFTGAHAGSLGAVRAADGGVLFLDEIGEMPLELQPLLLRVLQEREVTPVGATRPERIDVQVLAATNRDLEAEVEAGRFREDLLYRLNTILIELPPLRERPEDIPALVDHFSRQVAARLGLPRWEPDATTLARLRSSDWPGNLRELAQAVERMYVLGTCGAARGQARQPAATAPPRAASASSAGADPDPVLPLLDLTELRRLAVRQALAATNGHRGKAAMLLKVSPNTMTKLIADACPEHKSPRGRRPR